MYSPLFICLAEASIFYSTDCVEPEHIIERYLAFLPPSNHAARIGN